VPQGRQGGAHHPHVQHDRAGAHAAQPGLPRERLRRRKGLAAPSPGQRRPGRPAAQRRPAAAKDAPGKDAFGPALQRVPGTAQDSVFALGTDLASC